MTDEPAARTVAHAAAARQEETRVAGSVRE